MVILVVLGIVLTVGIVLWVKDFKFCTEMLGMIITLFSAIFMVIALMGLIFQPLETRRFLQQYEMIRIENEWARSEGDKIERMALRTQINTLNADLVELQYWNETVFDIFIPDDVMTTKLIR